MRAFVTYLSAILLWFSFGPLIAQPQQLPAWESEKLDDLFTFGLRCTHKTFWDFHTDCVEADTTEYHRPQFEKEQCAAQQATGAFFGKSFWNVRENPTELWIGAFESVGLPDAYSVGDEFAFAAIKDKLRAGRESKLFVLKYNNYDVGVSDYDFSAQQFCIQKLALHYAPEVWLGIDRFDVAQPSCFKLPLDVAKLYKNRQAQRSRFLFEITGETIQRFSCAQAYPTGEEAVRLQCIKNGYDGRTQKRLKVRLINYLIVTDGGQVFKNFSYGGLDNPAVTAPLAVLGEPASNTCNYGADFVGTQIDISCQPPAGYTQFYSQDLSPALGIVELGIARNAGKPRETIILLRKKVSDRTFRIVDAIRAPFNDTTRMIFNDGGDAWTGLCEYRGAKVLHLAATVNSAGTNPITADKAWLPSIADEKFVEVMNTDVKCSIPHFTPGAAMP